MVILDDIKSAKPDNSKYLGYNVEVKVKVMIDAKDEIRLNHETQFDNNCKIRYCTKEECDLLNQAIKKQNIKL